MGSTGELLQKLQEGRGDEALRAACMPWMEATPPWTRARSGRSGWSGPLRRSLSPAEAALFSGPGRTEIGGNHTDHQHGHVLCGSVDLDMLACAAPNGKEVIRIHSEGYPALEVELREPAGPGRRRRTPPPPWCGEWRPRLRSWATRPAGFDAYVTSNVLSGSGLSSSAAYEVLVGNILNRFCCGGALDSRSDRQDRPVRGERLLWQALRPDGPDGLLGGRCGGHRLCRSGRPVVKKVEYDFTRSGHALCIVDTGSCHADLTDDYADITREMGAVAAHFGKQFLREVPEADFRAAIPSAAGRSAATGRCSGPCTSTRMTAGRCRRREALERGDFRRFLALVNASGLSSALHLQNTWSVADPSSRPSLWPWPSVGNCWRALEPSGSMAEALPAPSRPLSPTTSWRPSSLVWRSCWAGACATSSTSVPRAAVWF